MSLNYENGEKGVEFKLVDAMNDGKGGIVRLEDIISASSESISVGIDNIKLLPGYHQDENMNISFSISNPGTIGFNGTASVIIESGGRRSMLYPDLDLGAGKSQDFEAVLKAPERPGPYALTINLELDDDTTVTKSVDYNVTMLNPPLTTLSTDIRDNTDTGGLAGNANKGLRGTVSFESAYPGELVKWDTNITMEIFRIVQNGRERTYSNNISVRENIDYNIFIPYSDFYQFDGDYLVSITMGNMKNDRMFKIKGQDGIYSPVERSEILLVTDIINSQLILLLIGMVVAFSVRNNKNQKSKLKIDTVIAGCGSIIFIAGIFQGWINVAVLGIFMIGIGLMLNQSRKNDARVDKLLTFGHPINDIIILTLIFLSTAFLILQIPEWNPILTLGTLTVYYIILNIKSDPDESVIPVEKTSPEYSVSKDQIVTDENPAVSMKFISFVLAIIILVGIVWTFYPDGKEQRSNIQLGGETNIDPGIPSETETPVVTETVIPEITPTGDRSFISLDRYRILRGDPLSINVGDEIIWINEGKDPITVVSDDIPGFTEKFLDAGKRTTPYMFTSPGIYNYSLKNNKNVNGTIKVT